MDRVAQPPSAVRNALNESQSLVKQDGFCDGKKLRLAGLHLLTYQITHLPNSVVPESPVTIE